MKKNKMMRIASILMVATLITTCAISGTFAKYVTKAEGSDSARVAKWGVVIEMPESGVFAEQYKTHDTTTFKGQYSVISDAKDNVVAPGTSSKDLDQQLTATLTGKPEVATKYEVAITGIKDIVLTGDNVNYAPLKWTLKIGNKSFTESLSGVIARASEIEGKLPVVDGADVTVSSTSDSITITIIAEPNVDISAVGDISLDWEWKFFVDDDTDVLDTAIGNIAAGVAVEGYTATTQVGATLTVSATQID